MNGWDYLFYIGGLAGWCIVIAFIFIVWIEHRLPSFCYAFTTENRLQRKHARLNRRINAMDKIVTKRSNIAYLKDQIEQKEKELAEAVFKSPQEFVDTE